MHRSKPRVPWFFSSWFLFLWKHSTHAIFIVFFVYKWTWSLASYTEPVVIEKSKWQSHLDDFDEIYSFYSLQNNGNWLNDMHLYFFISMINFTSAHAKVFSSELKLCKNSEREKEDSSRKDLFIFMNHDIDHWNIFYHWKNDDNLFFTCSLERSPCSKDTLFYTKYIQKLFDMPECPKLGVVQSSRQIDSYSSGYFAIWNVLCLVFLNRLESCDFLDPFRNFICCCY